MARVAVTGAGGNVGRETLRAFEETDHDVRPLTHSEHDDIDSQLIELTDYESLVEGFADQDVVFHYAAIAFNTDSWEEHAEIDVNGTQRVYEAAVETGVDRVVYASSYHVLQYANCAIYEDHGTVTENPTLMRPEDPPRPDSFYAITKIASEAFGSYYADRHGVEVINLRIGYLLSRAELVAIQDESNAAVARAQWLSPRDCRDAVRKAITADLPRNPLTVHLLSRNQERYLSIGEAMCGLGYEPTDDSSEVIDANGQSGKD